MEASLTSQDWKEISLSHHPELPCFQNDVIVLFHRRICAGCLLAYPTACLIVLVLHPFWSESITISLFFALLSQFRRVIHDNPLFGHYCRLLAGIAFGFGIGGFYWAAMTGQWLMVGLLITGAAIYFVLQLHSMELKLLQYQKNNS